MDKSIFNELERITILEDISHNNAETMQAIEDAENEINLVGPFNSVEELMKDLLS